jgi:hypothetical protein
MNRTMSSARQTKTKLKAIQPHKPVVVPAAQRKSEANLRKKE